MKRSSPHLRRGLAVSHNQSQSAAFDTIFVDDVDDSRGTQRPRAKRVCFDRNSLANFNRYTCGNDRHPTQVENCRHFFNASVARSESLEHPRPKLNTIVISVKPSGGVPFVSQLLRM